jgi:hypothetical protein
VSYCHSRRPLGCAHFLCEIRQAYCMRFATWVVRHAGAGAAVQQAYLGMPSQFLRLIFVSPSACPCPVCLPGHFVGRRVEAVQWPPRLSIYNRLPICCQSAHLASKVSNGAGATGSAVPSWRERATAAQEVHGAAIFRGFLRA